MIIAGTLSRYFAMRFLASVVGSLIGVNALAAMIDYVELMRCGLAKRHGLAARENLDVPRRQLTETIFPFTVLVGAMSCYLTLSRRHKLVVARAAGGFGLTRLTILVSPQRAPSLSRLENPTINRESGRCVRADHPWWEHGRSGAPYDLDLAGSPTF